MIINPFVFAAAGGGPSLPGTMLMHHDASAITGLSDGNTISIWNDLSGNGKNWDHLIGTPSWHTNIQNGLPGVLFGAGEGLYGNAGAGFVKSSGDFSLLFVCKLNNTSNAARRGIDGSSNWLLGPFVNTWQIYNGGFINSGESLTTNARSFLYTHTSGSAKLYTDEATSFSNAAPGWPDTIGYGNAHNGEDFLGYILEVGFWGRVLDATERGDAFDYAADKWGL